MIACSDKALYFGPVMWVFELIKKAYQVDVVTNSKVIVKIGIESDNHIQLSGSFYHDLINLRKYSFHNYFSNEPLIKLENGMPDYISTIFYLVNGFQEYDLTKVQQDKYGRLNFEQSLQYKFDVLEVDLVKDYAQKLLLQIDRNLIIPKRKSRVFISHDIDSIFGSLKYDGLWALKKGNIGAMMKIITKTVIQNPPWFNIDKVAKLESEYDIKACYYWIVQNGRSEDGIKNGDYKISNPKVQKQMNYATSLNNEIGLHKSTMKTRFDEEIHAISNLKSNRFHFLKINNPSSFNKMEESGIQSDSSIGFPYNMGFKNSCGMPYYPYDIDLQKKINVLEIPLQIMDGMFNITDFATSQKGYSKIIDFIESNKNNALISILWHNSEMTNFAYKWSFNTYKKLLQYFVDENFETVLPSQLVNEYETA